MPELPDIEAYVHALSSRVVGHNVRDVRLRSPFVLRTASPRPAELRDATVLRVSRLGKRIVIALSDDRYIVVHLMIAGRLRWHDHEAPITGKLAMAAIDFDCGTLVLTEAGARKRASVHIVRGGGMLAEHDAGGLEPLDASLEAFRAVMLSENHTIKRALTDPRLLAGIGNAYSDEILHAAHMSPAKLTSQLSAEELNRVYDAMQCVLRHWTSKIVAEASNRFPEKVTAFREGMAVHGRYGQPCPACSTPIQHIVYADKESNYCPECQTGGKLLADRALSRLLRSDWPRTLEELEERKKATAGLGGPEH